MSIWQFQAAVAGYVKANSAGPNKLSESEKDTLFDWIDNAGGGLRVLSTQTYRITDDRLKPAGVVTFAAG